MHVSVSLVFFVYTAGMGLNGEVGGLVGIQLINRSINQYLTFPGGQKQQLKGFRGLYIPGSCCLRGVFLHPSLVPTSDVG